ncbi:hypothetical protein NQ317_003564 [Molorchus minor]|uniref:SAC3/GANP/THP3 conserved domain-containing protein n=1 Tax=Molorchus minor TaxID=1323400 RepID=A0ABQ9IPZ6_9CUCU|nr:hypothetical protein NQ317_003564 [Molorchus minor]
MIASLHLPAIRRKALETMSVAYNSKNLSFPVQLLKELLLYDTEEQLISDCRYYGLEVQNNGVYFSKSLFDLKKSTTPQKHCCFV